MKLAAKISSLIQARENCLKSNNSEWFEKHTEELGRIQSDLLPSGSGIDCGTKINLDNSTPKKLVFTCEFHHMDEYGGYDGWTDHKVIALPAFGGIELTVTGKDRNQIKDYLHDVFYDVLAEECTA